MLAGAPVLFAQLQGTIKDASGAVVPGASIKVAGPATRSATSDAQGRYEFTNLPNGAYRLTIIRDGFALVERKVDVPTTASVDVELALSPVIETIETASRVQESAARVPFFISSVNPEELQKTAPASIEDTMRSIPGLQHGTQGNAFTRVSTRGFRDTSDVLTLIDGMPLRQVAGASDLTMVPVQMVRELEFVKGPASSVYGRSAVAGTMQFFTVPEREAGPSGNLSIGLASFNTQEYVGGASLPWKTGRVAGQGMATRSDGFQRDAGRDQNAFSLVGEQAAGSRINLRGHYLFSDVFAERGSIIPLANGQPLYGITRRDNFGIPGSQFDGRLNSASGKADIDLGHGALFTNTFNFNRYTRFSTGGITILPGPGTATKGYSESTAVQDTYLNDAILQWQSEKGPLRNHFTGGFTFEKGTQDQFSPAFTSAPTYRGPNYTTPVTFPNNDPRGIRGAITSSFFNQSIASLYTQDRLEAGRLGVTLGFRYDRFDQALRRSDTGVVSANVRSRVSPRVGVDVVALRRQSFELITFMNWVEGFRPQFPSLSTLNNLVVAQLLRPEVTRNVEGGYRLRGGRFSWQTTYFNMRKLDGQRSFRTGPETFFFVNATQRVRGVESELRTRVRTHTAWLHYSFHDARNLEFRPTLTTNFDGFRLRMAPRHVWGAGGLIHLHRRVTWSPAINFVGRRPLRDNIINPQVLPSYTLLSQAVSVELHRRWVVNFSGTNLTDRYYIADDFSAQDAGNAGVPRRFAVQVRYRF